MSIDVPERIEQQPVPMSVTLSEILDDLQRLVEQQFHLLKREVEEEVGQRITAIALLGSGLLALAVDALMISLCLVHLAHWLASPAGTDPAQIPLWGCYAIVSGVLLVVGGVLSQVGWSRLTSKKALSQNQGS